MGFGNCASALAAGVRVLRGGPEAGSALAQVVSDNFAGMLVIDGTGSSWPRADRLRPAQWRAAAGGTGDRGSCRATCNWRWPRC